MSNKNSRHTPKYTEAVDDFFRLMDACEKVKEEFSDAVVFIGGIAVYLHTKSEIGEDLAEVTHDADVYISIEALQDIRNDETLTPNRRLSKHQIIRDQFEFDIYTENLSKLRLNYDVVLSESVVVDGFKVASLPHLLLLKLAAYQSRQNSGKGNKDAGDLLKIIWLMDKKSVDISSIKGLLEESDVSLVKDVISKWRILEDVIPHGQIKSFRFALNTFTSKLEEIMKADQSPIQSTPSRSKKKP